MSLDTPRLRTRLILASLLAAALCGLAGCGGSGSSGFDAVPSESQAIEQAIDADTCTSFQGKSFCASGVKATGTFRGALIKIQDPQTPLTCAARPISEKCTVPLAFTTEGFNQPTSLLAAVAETEAGPWQLTQVTVTDVPGEANSPQDGRIVSIAVPGQPQASEPTPVIAAVLVFAGDVPGDLPPIAEHLDDFAGVDLVYVSQRLQVFVPR